MSQMREFFENLQLNFYLPKLNVVQPFLESVGKNKNLPDSHSSVEFLPGLSKFSHKCNLEFLLFISFSRDKLKASHPSRRTCLDDGCFGKVSKLTIGHQS
jgi:hypothetical protein